MVERPPSDRIQKTTSKIVLIGLAAATMMITVSIIGAVIQQEASAAKPRFCYLSDPDGPGGTPSTLVCRPNMPECRNLQAADQGALTECRPFRG
jgi:hypothetical protein